jgi:hypothetical protein
MGVCSPVHRCAFAPSPTSSATLASTISTRCSGGRASSRPGGTGPGAASSCPPSSPAPPATRPAGAARPGRTACHRRPARHPGGLGIAAARSCPARRGIPGVLIQGPHGHGRPRHHLGTGMSLARRRAGGHRPVRHGGSAARTTSGRASIAPRTRCAPCRPSRPALVPSRAHRRIRDLPGRASVPRRAARRPV